MSNRRLKVKNFQVCYKETSTKKNLLWIPCVLQSLWNISIHTAYPGRNSNQKKFNTRNLNIFIVFIPAIHVLDPCGRVHGIKPTRITSMVVFKMVDVVFLIYVKLMICCHAFELELAYHVLLYRCLMYHLVMKILCWSMVSFFCLFILCEKSITVSSLFLCNLFFYLFVLFT